MYNPKEFADLWDSWRNGNLEYVTDKVKVMKRSEILTLIVFLIDYDDAMLIDDLQSLSRMLDNRNL